MEEKEQERQRWMEEKEQERLKVEKERLQVEKERTTKLEDILALLAQKITKE